MTLQTVVPELLRALPELKPACDAEFNYYGEETPGAYGVFSTILRPAAFAALDREEESAARRYFDFYERVAGDPDADVQSLAGIELIEDLANDRRRLALAWPYMGPKTRQEARAYADSVKRQVGREIWLPE